RQHDRDPRRFGQGRNSEARAAGRAPDELPRGRSDHACRNGRRKSRLSEPVVMKQGLSSLGAIVVGIIAFILALKLLGAALKLVAIGIGLAIAIAIFMALKKGGGRA